MNLNFLTDKNFALACLVLQNTFLILFMRYSREKSEPELDGTPAPMYASSTAVTMMELLKLFCCIFMTGYEAGGISGLVQALNNDVFSKPMELVKTSVPSLLYTIQNNLLYFALSHLDACTFQVGYQTKILTTALFSVWMLGKQLSNNQWFSLVLLTIGVTLAQLSTQAPGAPTTESSTAGFVAVCLSAVTSGFAGVYFERILKTSSATIWMRNIQMGVSSILVSLFCIYFSGDYESTVAPHGFFYGYTNVVIAVIVLQAVGGLVVAVVVKYADNILKGFAASFSIITSCLISIMFFGFRPNITFLGGAILVNVAMYIYASYPFVAKAASGLTSSNTSSPTNRDEVDSLESQISSNVQRRSTASTHHASPTPVPNTDYLTQVKTKAQSQNLFSAPKNAADTM